jgi:hypothetical protein
MNGHAVGAQTMIAEMRVAILRRNVISGPEVARTSTPFRLKRFGLARFVILSGPGGNCLPAPVECAV